VGQEAEKRRKLEESISRGDGRIPQGTTGGFVRKNREAGEDQKPLKAKPATWQAEGLAGRASDEKPGLTPDVFY